MCDRVRSELVCQCVFGGVANQTSRIMHLVHHLVAAVDARGTADALVLQAVADVDAGRAHLDADAAIDAIADSLLARIDRPCTRAPRLAPLAVVGDHQRVLVEHHALEARVRTHVLAHLLAEETSVAVGGEAVEEDPKRLPRTQLPRHSTNAEISDRREVADKAIAGPQGDDEPGDVLESLDDEFLQRHRGRVEADASAAITFDLAFDPEE